MVWFIEIRDSEWVIRLTSTTKPEVIKDNKGKMRGIIWNNGKDRHFCSHWKNAPSLGMYASDDSSDRGFSYTTTVEDEIAEWETIRIQDELRRLELEDE